MAETAIACLMLISQF